MDTNDDGTRFAPPRPEAPLTAGPPLSSPVPPPPPGVYAPPYQPVAFGSQGSDPAALVVPTGTAVKRSRGKVVGGLIAVVALFGAGGFAITRIVAGNDGGAATPTEVGTRLMDSLAAEDALGVVDLLLPGERDMMRQPLIDIVDNLKRLKIVDGTASLDKVGGLDIAFTDVQVDPTETNVDDVTDIRITASGTASVDGAAVPIGDLLIDEAFGGDRPTLDSAPQSSDIDWKLAAVKRDGRWYLSAFYSLAENSRAEGEQIPETPIVARGSDTPQGAVQAIFDAVDDLDYAAFIAALNPNEAEALQRYGPIFVDDMQKSLDALDLKIAFSDTKFSVTGSGDRRTVTIDGFTMKASSNDTDVTVEIKGGCVVMTTTDSTIDTCEGGSAVDTAVKALGLEDNGDLKSFVKTVQDAFADMRPVGLTVQQVNGKWFVSPVGSIADLFLAELSALDNGELTDIIDGAKKVAGSIFIGGIFSAGSGTSIGGIGSDGGDTGDSGLVACLAETIYSAYVDCIAAGIDDGSIDPSSVSPYYRFDECGAGDLYFNGDVYAMEDEAFTAFAIGVAPCFQKYVADGTISEFELPYELARPDCLEGRNWYNVADQDYMDRVFACVS